MKTRAESGTTRYGESIAMLVDNSNEMTILKAYVSPDGEKIRIVLSELVNYTQTVINPDSKMIEFDRKSRRLK